MWSFRSRLVALDLWTDLVAHDANDLAGIGVPAERGLREDQFTVERDLEAPLR
jgi:hypothetical protein